MDRAIVLRVTDAVQSAAKTVMRHACVAGLVANFALIAIAGGSAGARPTKRRTPSSLPLGEPVAEDPAAEFDELRSSLDRLRVPPNGRIERPERRAKAFQAVELLTIEGASDFKSDRVLSNRVLLIEELLRHERMQELLERTRVTSPSGRNRREGQWLALYLYMAAGGAKNPYDLAQTEAVQHGARVSGFGDWVPSKSLIDLRFSELESKWQVIANAVGELIAIVCEAVPELVDVVFVDSTAGRSPARLEHCCTDLQACKRAGKSEGELSPAEWDKKLKEARWAEAELPEQALPADPRTRQAVVLVDDETKRCAQLYRLFLINGHWYRSLDVTSGFRRYDNGVMWHGAYHQFAVSPVVWLPVGAHCFPCDIQEWDGYPNLLDCVETFTGRRPYLVSTDRGFSISSGFEYSVRRGVVLVAARRGINDKNPRINQRRPEFDEHGLPRCGFCGGVGLVDLPGLGLERRGRDPRIAFVCAAPFFPECELRQVIDPSLAWPSVLALSRLTELYQAARYWRNPSEGVHRRIRWNYLVAGNDVGSQTFRPGVPAQRLRMWSGLLIAWWQLNLRHGWIESRGLDVTINDSRLTRLTGVQDRLTGRIITPGAGTDRLARLLNERVEHNTDLPYGDALERLRDRVVREVGLQVVA
jgi:hypothetical protein